MWLEKSLYLIKDNTKWLIKKSEKIEGNIYNFTKLSQILLYFLSHLRSASYRKKPTPPVKTKDSKDLWG